MTADNPLSTRILAVSTALVVALPVATWWAVGDLSEKGYDHLDYMVRPVPVPPVLEGVLGGFAAVVVAASLVVLGVGRVRGSVPRSIDATVAPLCVAGVIVGWGWRVVTAGVIGANIGGGMVMLLVLPVAVVLVAAAVANAMRPGP